MLPESDRASLQVVRVIARLNIGGPSRHVAVLEEGLHALGYNTLLLYGEADSDEGSLAHLVLEQHLPAVQVPRLTHHVKIWSDLIAFGSVTRTIFKIKPDVVHTHTAKAGILGRAAAILYNTTRRKTDRCLVLHTYHGNVFRGYFNRTMSFLVCLIERLIGIGTDRIAVVSEQQRREIVDDARVAPPTKVKVMPLGLNLDAMLRVDAATPTLRREFNLPDESLVLGFVGRFVPIKDLTTLVHGFALTKHRFPNASLLLAGDGPLRNEIATLVESLGLRHAVVFLGWRHDLPMLYATLDIAVLSSINEGTPVSLIEAMAAARSVVATDVGGVRDLVSHQQTGLLVPPSDPAELAKAIESLAQDTDLRVQMGHNARRVVASRYRHERLITDIDHWYRTELETKRRNNQ